MDVASFYINIPPTYTHTHTLMAGYCCPPSMCPQWELFFFQRQYPPLNKCHAHGNMNGTLIFQPACRITCTGLLQFFPIEIFSLVPVHNYIFVLWTHGQNFVFDFLWNLNTKFLTMTPSLILTYTLSPYQTYPLLHSPNTPYHTTSP